jgi:cysteine desulfurase
VRNYLDHASATPLRPAAREAMQTWVERLGEPDGAGDPARIHQEGREAREAIETSRAAVAALCGVPANRVVFTSGGTEAANTAVVSAEPGRVLCARVEHSSVRRASQRAGETLEIAVGSDGRIDPDHLGALLGQGAGPGKVLVHCQWGNHETGALQPIVAVADLCARRGAVLHIDAVAAFGHVPLDLGELTVDYVSLSAHKMGGPAGTGAVVLGRGVRLRPLLVGGSEERGRRAGAENLLGIVGFGAAAADLGETRLAEEATEAVRWRDALVAAACRVPGVDLVGPREPEQRLPHIACLSISGVLGEAVLLALDQAGIAAHSGSACSSETFEPSPVLEAMGLDPDRSLRVSVGWSTSAADVDRFAAAFHEAVGRLRSLASGEARS